MEDREKINTNINCVELLCVRVMHIFQVLMAEMVGEEICDPWPDIKAASFRVLKVMLMPASQDIPYFDLSCSFNELICTMRSPEKLMNFMRSYSSS
jgi:hypothetical protein